MTGLAVAAKIEVNIQLLPSSFNEKGSATPEQRLTCFIIDDKVAVDAGSIGLALSRAQRESVRDVIVTHSHIDHTASLPILVDDLFASLREPIRIHATENVIALLEKDVFNWDVYPRFSELQNDYGPVIEYVPFESGMEFQVAHLRILAVPVNHIVPTVGLIVSDEGATVAFSSDTAETQEFWRVVNGRPKIDALVIEASFPVHMSKLAEVSRHLTPATLEKELRKFRHNGTDIYAVHLKAAYRAQIIKELEALKIPHLRVMEPGRTYEF